MIPKLPKYKYLITYRLSEVIFDLVDVFVLRYLSHLGNLNYLSLKDQMLKCTRSIKQNIIEGVSEVASLKSQIKLLGVAYGSVEELIADFEDFAQRQNLFLYPKTHPKIQEFRQIGIHLSNLSNLSHLGRLRIKPFLPASTEEAVNFILTLCHQLSFLLKRQIEATENKFITEGGYTENLFKKRLVSRKSPRSPKSLKSFTLMELLIIVSLIAIIAITTLISLRPKTQIDKGQDAKRKTELSQLQKALEDWYNDKNCYPKPQQICYDSPNNNICHICGNKSTSPSFSPYLSRLPCDPNHPVKQYLYQVDNLNCPSWYRIYTILNNQNDQAIKEVGCQYGCGPLQNYIYNYGVTSPNTSLEKNIYLCSYYSPLYISLNNLCNNCGSYQQCLRNFPNSIYYIDSRCQRSCVKN